MSVSSKLEDPFRKNTSKFTAAPIFASSRTPANMHPHVDSQVRDDNQQDVGSYRIALERLLHVYEPGNEASAAQLLNTYAGMEHELVECYRLYYAGKGSFRVALDGNQEAGLQRASSSEPLHLPTSAISTYLHAKLQSRRGGAARNAKLEDVRGPTATGSPSERRLAAITSRRRAVSFTASLQHEAGARSDEDEADLLRRRDSLQ